MNGYFLLFAYAVIEVFQCLKLREVLPPIVERGVGDGVKVSIHLAVGEMGDGGGKSVGCMPKFWSNIEYKVGEGREVVQRLPESRAKPKITKSMREMGERVVELLSNPEMCQSRWKIVNWLIEGVPKLYEGERSREMVD